MDFSLFEFHLARSDMVSSLVEFSLKLGPIIVPSRKSEIFQFFFKCQKLQKLCLKFDNFFVLYFINNDKKLASDLKSWVFEKSLKLQKNFKKISKIPKIQKNSKIELNRKKATIWIQQSVRWYGRRWRYAWYFNATAPSTPSWSQQFQLNVRQFHVLVNVRQFGR